MTHATLTPDMRNPPSHHPTTPAPAPVPARRPTSIPWWSRTWWMACQVGRELKRCRWRIADDLRAWRRFWRSLEAYRALAPADAQPQMSDLWPCVRDATAHTPIEPIYFHQNAWGFERIVRNRPAEHVDIASHHAFTSLLSKVLPVTMVDIRPLSLDLPSLRFQRGTITELPYEDRSVESISSLCVVEHIGLGRYGDELDPRGSEKAFAELQRVVAPNGRLVISVPVGPEARLYFNAQRTFTELQVLEYLSELQLIDRGYIYGRELVSEARDCEGVACYEFQRPSPEAAP